MKLVVAGDVDACPPVIINHDEQPTIFLVPDDMELDEVVQEIAKMFSTGDQMSEGGVVYVGRLVQ